MSEHVVIALAYFAVGSLFGYTLDRFLLRPVAHWHAAHVRYIAEWREGRDPRSRTRRDD